MPKLHIAKEEEKGEGKEEEEGKEKEDKKEDEGRMREILFEQKYLFFGSKSNNLPLHQTQSDGQLVQLVKHIF